MDTKRFLIGTLVGGITYFILGYVFYVVLFGSFFEANAGSATGVMKTDMAWWALILGSLALAALLSYIFLKWAHVSTIQGGLKAGATIGFLLGLAYDLISYATSNFLNLTATLADVVITTVMIGIVGAVIGAVLHTKAEASHAPAA